MNNLYAIFGDDESQVKRKAKEIMMGFSGSEPDEFSIDIFTVGDNTDDVKVLANCISSIRTPSFFGGTKTVWLKNFEGFSKEGNQKSKDLFNLTLRNLAELIKKGIPEDVNFLISGSNISKAKSFYKICNKYGTVENFAKVQINDKNWRANLTAMIKNLAEKKGLKLKSETIFYLTEVIGVDTTRIDAELEKISCYCDIDKEIFVSNIQDICVGDRESDFFSLNNALGKRNLKDAMLALRRAASQAKDPESLTIGFFSAGFSYFKQLLQAKIFLTTLKIRPEAVPNTLTKLSEEKKLELQGCSDFINGNPYAAKYKAIDSIQYSGPEIIEAIHLFADAYKKSITFVTKKWLLLETVIVTIIAGDKIKE